MCFDFFRVLLYIELFIFVIFIFFKFIMKKIGIVKIIVNVIMMEINKWCYLL